MSALRTLWLVRHGHTVWHVTGGIAGRTDIALSDAGRAAVGALRPSLEQALVLPGGARRPVHRWASPLLRTRDTAVLLGADPGSLRIDARLVELDFGDWEGSTWDAVHRDTPDVLAAWGEDWVQRGPPNGESFAAQIARCGDWLHDLDRDAAGDSHADTDTAATALVVAHGGTLRALLVAALGLAPERAMGYAIAPAHVCRLDRDAGAWRLRGWNLPSFEP